MLNRVREFVPCAGANVRKTHEGLQTSKKKSLSSSYQRQILQTSHTGRHHTRGKYFRRVTHVAITPVANILDESHMLSYQRQIHQTSHTCYFYQRRIHQTSHTCRYYTRGKYTRPVTHVVIIPEANTPDQLHMSLSYQRQIHQTSYTVHVVIIPEANTVQTSHTCRYHTRGTQPTADNKSHMSLSTYQRDACTPDDRATHIAIIPEAHCLLQTISHTCRYPHIGGMHALLTSKAYRRDTRRTYSRRVTHIAYRYYTRCKTSPDEAHISLSCQRRILQTYQIYMYDSRRI